MPNLLQEELINAGELKHRATYQIKEYDGTKDSHGNRNYQWVDVVSRWVFVKTVGARESLTTDRLKIVASHLIVCRYIPGATALGRFLYKGKPFNISYVNDINEQHVQHQFFVSEVVNPT